MTMSNLWYLYILAVVYGVKAFSAPADTCANHPIYCRILEVRPTVNKKLAFRLSNYIHKYSKKYNTDPLVSVAIAMQESRIRNINRYQTIALPGTSAVLTGVSDIGIFQIHVRTAQRFDISIDRLLTDVEYQVEQHTRILSHKTKVCSRPGNRLRVKPNYTWSCYHSYTPRLRRRYRDLVRRYL